MNTLIIDTAYIISIIKVSSKPEISDLLEYLFRQGAPLRHARRAQSNRELPTSVFRGL